MLDQLFCDAKYPIKWRKSQTYYTIDRQHSTLREKLVTINLHRINYKRLPVTLTYIIIHSRPIQGSSKVLKYPLICGHIVLTEFSNFRTSKAVLKSNCCSRLHSCISCRFRLRLASRIVWVEICFYNPISGHKSRNRI